MIRSMILIFAGASFEHSQAQVAVYGQDSVRRADTKHGWRRCRREPISLAQHLHSAHTEIEEAQEEIDHEASKQEGDKLHRKIINN